MLPSIRLRPVGNLTADLPLRLEEEEEEDEEIESEEDRSLTVDNEVEYEDGGVEGKLVVQTFNEHGVEYEQVEYQDQEMQEWEEQTGHLESGSDAAEVAPSEVEGDLALEGAYELASGKGEGVHGLPISPTRSARKRSCDDEELELDHAGRTIARSGESVPRADRQITPPKRQKTSPV